tara:strand:+ start:221 stop:424 length:204 start_codon:yes stop_codon:yes gene_type:complete
MLPSTKALASDIRFAVMDSLKHQGIDKHQALLAVVDLIDDKEALREAMHSGLDQYCNYLKSIKNYDF